MGAAQERGVSLLAAIEALEAIVALDDGDQPYWWAGAPAEAMQLVLYALDNRECPAELRND